MQRGDEQAWELAQHKKERAERGLPKSGEKHSGGEDSTLVGEKVNNS